MVKDEWRGIDDVEDFGLESSPKIDREQNGHGFNYKQLLRQLNPLTFIECLVTFSKHVPHFLWSFFIEAFLIPSYRPEWTQYSQWKAIPDSDSDSAAESPENIRKKLDRKRKKYLKLTSLPPKPVKHNHSLCQVVTINVSGKLYKTQLRTLAAYPDTLLGDPKRRAKLYDPIHQDYFLDRNRTCFDAILYYYQSRGILRRPFEVSLQMFEEEIRFYDLGSSVIETLRREEGILTEAEKPVPRRFLQRKYWLLFEYPESSKQAKIVAILSIVAVVLSVLLFCLETLDQFQRGSTDLEDLLRDNSFSFDDPFVVTEASCMCWFVFELLFRVINAPRKVAFFKSMSNVIDLLAILPFFISLFISQQEDNSNKNLTKATSLTVFRVIRLVRVFRILKLSRHNRGLKILGKTLRASIRELGLLMFFLLIGVILFSSGVYFAELHNPNSHFRSILDAFWWSVITMTTCGYGDNVPITVSGKLVGALCAVSGVLTLALPVPVIVSNFNNFYTREDESSDVLGDFEHVEQCPYRSGWYASDGSVMSDNGEFNWHSKTKMSLNGENQKDDSDSDFDSLRKIDYDTNSVKFRKRKTLRKTTTVNLQREKEPDETKSERQEN